jgi:hypothetical protein
MATFSSLLVLLIPAAAASCGRGVADIYSEP